MQSLAWLDLQANYGILTWLSYYDYLMLNHIIIKYEVTCVRFFYTNMNKSYTFKYKDK